MLKPPKHLKPTTKKWFRQVIEDYVLEPHHIKILTLAAETWDRCQEAREILDTEGLTYLDRFGCPRARPEVSVERDSRIAFARLVRELCLDIEPPEEPGRPPRLYK